MKEIAITQVTPTTNPVYKRLTYSGRTQFTQDVTYTLADGREIPSYVSSDRKKDLPERLASAQNNAAIGAMAATFDDVTGQFWGTVTRYDIGNRGLVPRIPQPQPTPTQPELQTA